MKQFCVSVAFLLVSGFALYAQDFPVGEKQTEGVELHESPSHPLLKKNTITQDSRIGVLLQNHIAMNKRRNGIEGHRLEIFFSSDYNAREKALEVKTEFLKRYPDMDAYIQFQSPNFRVRVGNFRTKSDALKAKEQIKPHYPNAFRVDDIIQFPELITQEDNNE